MPRCSTDQHGMARPQAVVGGEDLQISRVAAYILNKKLQTADNGRLSSLEVGQGDFFIFV